MVGYHKRFDPAYCRAREEVLSLRDLRYVEATVLHPDDGEYRTHHAVLPVRPWEALPEAEINRGAVREATEGVMGELVAQSLPAGAPVAHRVGVLMLYQSLIHDVNALRGILGEPEAVVSAEIWRGGMAQHSITRFPNDVRVSMSWVSLPGVKHYEERLRFVSPEKRVTLVFPSPYLRHFPSPLSVERMDGDQLVVEQRTVSYEEAFRAELHHFHACLREGRDPRPSLDDALGDARWIQEIANAY
jgi:predicted dehydrogenase